ncbi:MAG: chromate transporter [Rhizobacter sp.]
MNTEPRSPASCTELFWVFTRLALQGFGGVLAVAQRELVEKQRWLTAEEFLQMLSLAQVLPGPNVVNLALMLGDRFFGWRGALAALAGMLSIPLVIVLVLASSYEHSRHLPLVSGALHGMGVVAAGLIAATALKLAPSLRSNSLGWVLCALLVVVTVLTVAIWRWPLWTVVLGGGGCGMLAAWYVQQRQRHQGNEDDRHA